MTLGDRGRQGRDRDLVGDVLEHAALLDAGRVLGAEQLDRDLGLDLLVELDLLAGRGGSASPRTGWRCCSLTTTGTASEPSISTSIRAPPWTSTLRSVALADLERARLRAGAVDDAGNEARRGAGGGSSREPNSVRGWALRVARSLAMAG